MQTVESASMLLVLQGGFLEFIANPEASWILVPILALLIPIVAILLEPVKQRMRAAERRESRQAYERIAREKLEVIKAGITMGYSQQELRELDARLGKLIGEDQLKKLLNPGKTGKLDKQLEIDAQHDLDAMLNAGPAKVQG